MDILRVLLDPPYGGAWNMAFDEALLEHAPLSGPTLRLYRWAMPTLSLGYFQRYEDRHHHQASLSCPVVRRPSGGGAILHDRELTYALVLPTEHHLASRPVALYSAVHQALVSALKAWNVSAEILWNETLCQGSTQGEDGGSSRPARAPPSQPARGEAHLSNADNLGLDLGRSLPPPFMCFARRSCGDVVVGPHKIAGSAQKRIKTGILQHGSILLGRSPFAPEFPGLADLLSRCIQVERLISDFVEEVGALLRLRPTSAEARSADIARAQELLTTKYRNGQWTMKIR